MTKPTLRGKTLQIWDVVEQVLNAEIGWCVENPAKEHGLSEEYEEGFMAGIRQSKRLIKRALEATHDK